MSNYRAIRALLKQLAPSELRYLELTINTALNIQKLIDKNGFTRAQVCERFGLKPSQYTAFRKGAVEYDLKTIATLNAWWSEIEIEKLAKREPVQFKDVNEK